jgi:hypothetical protein
VRIASGFVAGIARQEHVADVIQNGVLSICLSRLMRQTGVIGSTWRVNGAPVGLLLLRKSVIKRGATRIVFLVGKYAIKIPNVSYWRTFLYGLLGNMQEVAFSTLRSEKLCPVVFSFPGGFLLIMPRAEPISQEEFEAIEPTVWNEEDGFVVPGEHKWDSYGRLNGRIVRVDYGE